MEPEMGTHGECEMARTSMEVNVGDQDGSMLSVPTLSALFAPEITTARHHMVTS